LRQHETVPKQLAPNLHLVSVASMKELIKTVSSNIFCKELQEKDPNLPSTPYNNLSLDNNRWYNV